VQRPARGLRSPGPALLRHEAAHLNLECSLHTCSRHPVSDGRGKFKRGPAASEGTMSNDDPTSLRMLFGYEQARTAGVVGFSGSRTAWQMDFDLKESKARKEIRALVGRNPSFEPRVRQLIREHASGESEWWPVQVILFVLKCEMASRSKTGFTVTGHDGKSYRSDKVARIYTDGLSIIHEGRPLMLHIQYIKSIDVNTPKE
jgi:hypothetical protein